MLAFFVVLQVIVALFMILVVLLQPGNRGGAGAALGGAGGDTVFGGRGANTFLAKLTLGAAVCFMVTNFGLSYLSSPASRQSVTDVLPKEQPKPPEEHKAPAAGEEQQEPAAQPSAQPESKPETLQENVAPTEAPKAKPESK